MLAESVVKKVVVEKCCRECLKSVGEMLSKSAEGKCCREVLEKSVVEKCPGRVW